MTKRSEDKKENITDQAPASSPDMGDLDRFRLITENLKLNEARLGALYELSQMTDTTTEDMSGFVLEKAVDLTKSVIGFVGFMSDDEEVFIIHRWSHHAMDGCDVQDKPIHFPVAKAGIWAEAVRQRRTIVINEYDKCDDLKKGLPEGHVSLTRLISVPVFAGDRIVALAAVGNKDVDYDETDVNQLSLLMAGFWQNHRRILASEQLRQAKMEAEAANQAKNDFLANVSHEIRTPMSGILGVIELLLRGEVTEQQEEYLRIAQRSARSLMGIINEILDFSKIEAGMLDIRDEEFSPREVARSATDSLQVEAVSKGLKLSCTVDPDLPSRVRGDPDRVLQVLINLAGNAVKFTDGGEVSVRVRAGDDFGTPAAKRILHFSVRDTGPGVPGDKIDLLFETFHQLDGSLTRKHGGTGLGLAISKRIIERMGGTIEVESTVGAGSTFSFTVPVRVVHLSPENHVAEGPSPSQGEGPAEIAKAPASILLVEDDQATRLLLSRFITRNNWRVTSVPDGPSALEAVKADRFDAVLMDVQMPGMNGLETTRAIRALDADRGGHTPVIGISAHALEKYRVMCLDAGMDDYLSKPVEAEDLYASVERVMARRP